ncbi:MAG: tRNA adenosine(34) deaminase TadA [Anaerolineae bacterium]
MREEHERFMRLALEEAAAATATGDIPVGAVAVFAGAVVGRGHNEKELRQDATAHAEMLALRQASEALSTWRLCDVTLYCTLEPCTMCAGAMVLTRLSRLVYATDDPKAGAAGSILDLVRMPAMNHRVEVVRGVLADEADALLKRFFAGLRADRDTCDHSPGRCQSG